MQSSHRKEALHSHPRNRTRFTSILSFGCVFLLIAIGSHASLLLMPYFWDEVGQYVPSALDLYRDGAWIPHSAPPTPHPPGVTAWIALWWKIFSPSVLTTRLSMLFLSGLALLASFLLAVELCGSLPGVPALFAVALLAASPLFYTQSILAQLDLPALAATSLGLYLFLRERHGWAAIACTVLVLVKETGVLLPLLLAIWLLFERRFKRFALYLIPVAALGVWLAILRNSTGNWLGSTSFVQYNLLFSLRSSQIALAFVRRFYYLFIGDFHFIGTVAIAAAWRAGWLSRRRWKVAALFAAAHALLVTCLGGAVLERYMLPVLPVFYTAAVIGFHTFGVNLRWLAFVALFAGLVAGLFLNPLFWPYPYENNLGMSDFTGLQKKTANWLSENAGSKIIATAWPLSAVLKNPDFGYVPRKLMVTEIQDFSTASVQSIPKDTVEVFVRFSKDWEPPFNFLHRRAGRWLARRYLDYREPASPDEISSRLELRLAAAFERGGQWVEIYTN